LQDHVVAINRVAKVVKGGRRFSFSALVVVGDGKKKVGFGVGKANEVPDAIKKASDQAKKNMVSVSHLNGTIPFEVEGEFGSAMVQMYPAKVGTGLIAGGPVRVILELSGMKDIVCKVHGSKNSHNVVRAAMDGLGQLLNVEAYAKARGLALEDVQQKRHPAAKK
nr:30S ribosomal protein S5 [Oligoflexales bacterium]